MSADYQPSAEILARYADLLVTFALRNGEGVKPGEVIQLTVPDVAKPLLLELERAVLQAGAHPKIHFIPTRTDKLFFAHAAEHQLTFFPEAFKRAEADLIDHSVNILAEADPRELQDVPPEKLFLAMDARQKFREWLFEKERQGKFTWTLALYGTPEMAAEAGMSIEEYWHEIINACYLDAADPIAEWRRIQKEQERLKTALDALQIERVHVEGEGIDLWVRLGPNRKWLGGSGHNIPSFELFISPDWRGTEGVIVFDQPLYRYGNILRGVRLRFEKGLVVEATADEGQSLLEAMIKRENADKIGEFSLTDRRFSRITRFMANTLFDENIGGPYGNSHIAVGRAYKDSYTGDASVPTDADWDAWGYNVSPEHTDIITTADRVVTAHLPDGSTRVIFMDGQFTL